MSPTYKKRPRPHTVRDHDRKNTHVDSYPRGSGTNPSSNVTKRTIVKDEKKQIPKGLKGIDFEKGYLTEREVNLIKNRLSHGKLDFDDIPFPDEGFKISPTQTQKGLKWLMNQWKTPRGIERKNNPFGGREEAILGNFKEFRLQDFYDSSEGRTRTPFYVPYYRVISNKGGSFEYAVYYDRRNPKQRIHILG